MGARFISSVVLIAALVSPSGTAAFQPSINPQSPITSLDAVSRREVLGGTAAAASAALVAGIPLDALAADSKSFAVDPANFSWNGVYKDIKHPKGYRTIAGAVNKPGTLTLADDLKGTTFSIPLKASKNEKTGLVTLNIDFSEYGGDTVVGTVNLDSSISFPDGNVWKKEQGIVGVYIDGYAPYPKYRRVIRQGEGKLEVDMVSGKKEFKITAKGGDRAITVDFPGKTCTAAVNKKKGIITFSDGNVWTKV